MGVGIHLLLVYPMKAAVVLYVKDEAHDILTWLIWHKLVGFETFIICDDQSSDGTYALLHLASQHFDVRLHRNLFPEISYFYFRQEAFYKLVLQRYSEEFKWLAFFDADEYLSIGNNLLLEDFLSDFEGADAIAVNWALYGSNGNVLTPRVPSVAAFIRHSDRLSPICSHVKSIVRPLSVGSKWLNVHAFDVPVYRNCDNQPFHWGHTAGITREAPTWDRAKLMHFQLRSMEQFVERSKRRTDVKADRSLFDALDQNTLMDPSPLLRLSDINTYLRAILADICNKCVTKNLPTSFSGDWATFYLTTYHGDRLTFRNGVLATCIPGDGEIIAAMSVNEGKCVLIDGGPGGEYLAYHSSYSPIPAELLLQDCSNLKFLTAIPASKGGHFETTRTIADVWETFTARPTNVTINSRAKSFLEFFNRQDAPQRLFATIISETPEQSKWLHDAAVETTNQNDVALAAKLLGVD